MRLLLDAPVDLARGVEGREGSHGPAVVTSCPIGMSVRLRLGGGLNLVPYFAMVTLHDRSDRAGRSGEGRPPRLWASIRPWYRIGSRDAWRAPADGAGEG